MPRTCSKRACSPQSSSNNASSTNCDGEVYFQHLVAEQIWANIDDENWPSDIKDKIDNNDDSSSVGTVNSLDVEGIFATSSMRKEHDTDNIVLDNVLENKVGNVAPPKEMDIAKGKEEKNNPPNPCWPSSRHHADSLPGGSTAPSVKTMASGYHSNLLPTGLLLDKRDSQPPHDGSGRATPGTCS